MRSRENEYHWTDERVDLMRKLLAEGLTFRRVADRLGGGVSRNAVIGKARRIGAEQVIKARRSLSEKKKRVRPAPSPKPIPIPFVLPDVAESPHADITPEVQRVSIMQLREGMCRWLHGDPREPRPLYCGAPQKGDRPYCPDHCRIAYQPPVARAFRQIERV